MTPDFPPEIMTLLPELILALGGMVMLVIGVFARDRAQPVISALAVVALAGAALALFTSHGRLTAFNGAFVVDDFARFVKVLVLGGAALVLIMGQGFIRRERMAHFEFPVLVVFAVTGMMLMVSANDFLTLYMGLELQSLSLYVLASFDRDNLRSTEAGLKYFVLGALSSGMMLYGISLLYGFSGHTGFAEVASAIRTGGVSIGVIFGLVFLAAGLAFKVSAVPFHMWTPDVYEGAPTPITAFFAASPKIAAMALFVRAFEVALPDALEQWRQIIIFISILSMIIGSIAAIGQTNIKRLMAYSSIGHMGYALIGLAAGTAAGIEGVLIYLAIYLVTNIGAFVCILAMRRDGKYIENISDLAGLRQTNPFLAFAFAAIMFSLAGIPPLAGFFAKFYVFLAAVQAGLFPLAVIGFVASVIGAFYYVRIVKIMYFDEPAAPFERDIGTGNWIILGAATVFTVLYCVLPGPLIDAARASAAALIP